MANAESHGLSKDLSQFLESIDKKMEYNEKNEASDRYFTTLQGIPNVLRQQNINVYSPTTISIGPLHRGTEHLQAMEPVKLSYMSELFQRTDEAMFKNFEETKKRCARAMLKLEQRVRNFYEPARLQPKTENVSLAEVMLIDGCFIIELLYRFTQTESEDDLILLNPFKYYAVKRDMLLLENQIPFFVLRELFNLTVKKQMEFSQESISEWVLSFFGDTMGIEKGEREKMKKVSGTPHHILHLVHIYYVPSGTHHSESSFICKERTKIKYSATELRLAGVKLKAGKETNIFDIKFTTPFRCSSCFLLFRKGHLEIPPFYISDSTESFLKNIIAFELSCPHIASNYFTSLCFLMDLLIDTPEDVKLCEQAGIIHNYLGCRDEVAKLFNGICKNAIPRRFLYGKQYEDAVKFCKPWRVSSGRLRHDYFGNPWTGISVIAAIILFALTFISTLYAMLSYHY